MARKLPDPNLVPSHDEAMAGSGRTERIATPNTTTSGNTGGSGDKTWRQAGSK